MTRAEALAQAKASRRLKRIAEAFNTTVEHAYGFDHLTDPGYLAAVDNTDPSELVNENDPPEEDTL